MGKRGLRIALEPLTLSGRTAFEPESSASGADQHSQRAAVVVGGGLHGSAQAGDALVQLTKLDQAIAEVHARAVMPGIARQHAPEALGRAGEVAFVLQGDAKADQRVRVTRRDRESARE